jgi:histidinol-phosphate aminotransferase
MSDHDKPPELYDGLRLHQNENTGGCSPRVLDALRGLRADQIGVYPPYQATVEACARYFGIDPGSLLLTNGLDEGLFAIAVTLLAPSPDGTIYEAIVPQPAFEMFEFDTSIVGGRTIRVMPRPDFAFALDEVLAAITPRTRVVFLTNPNNPTGVSMAMADIRTIAGRVPDGGIVFVDEAYADFAGRSFVSELGAFSNVIVGRTFSKAHGLAGLRLGALLGNPVLLNPLRRAVPVYSVNLAAIVAVQAALDDPDHVRDYLRQVKESKAILYATCERLGLTYWKSDANFVLVRTGAQTEAVLSTAMARGVYLRDRSKEPGCEGCIRITTGIVEHTRQALAVMDEVLCAAR